MRKVDFLSILAKGEKGKSLTARSGDFLSSFLVDMAFLFIGPPECTLVQRGGERESKPVHVKPPRQLNSKKKLLQESSKPTALPAVYWSTLCHLHPFAEQTNNPLTPFL